MDKLCRLPVIRVFLDIFGYNPLTSAIERVNRRFHIIPYAPEAERYIRSQITVALRRDYRENWYKGYNYSYEDYEQIVVASCYFVCERDDINNIEQAEQMLYLL